MQALPRGSIVTALTKREVEIYNLVVEGMNNLEIANKLFICEKTVKFHLTHIFSKLNCSSRAKLIAQHYMPVSG